MKGLLITIVNIAAIVGLTVAAYLERGYYTIGGEVVAIAAIAIMSLTALSKN